MADKIGRNEFVTRDPVSGELQVIDMTTGEVISSSSNLIPEQTFAFSYEMAMLICQKIAAGATFADLDRDPDVPPLHIINHWRRSQAMFDAEIKLARKQRADMYHDRVAEVAANAAELRYVTREELANAKLAADQYRWLAEKGNPDAYGNKVTHEGSEEKPITMRVINTGINRNLPDVVVQSKEVTNGEINTGTTSGAERSTNEETRGTGTGAEEHSSTGESAGSDEGDTGEGT